ncbi:MAG: hypothetical protein JXX28_04010 [Deltaproteobacteria bacterium]|nr:hypothetical protein [Deltaproteobacteria bacterium]
MGYKCYYRCVHCGGMNRVPSERIQLAPSCGRCKEDLDTSGAPMRLPDEEVERLMEKVPVPLLLAFVAEGSEGSERLQGVLRRLGAEFTGTLMVLEIDAYRNAAKHEQFGIVSVPQLYLVKDRDIKARKQGFRTYEELKRLLDRHVNPYDV